MDTLREHTILSNKNFTTTFCNGKECFPNSRSHTNINSAIMIFKPYLSFVKYNTLINNQSMIITLNHNIDFF